MADAGAPGERALPKNARLRRRAEFLRVQEKGQKLTAGPFLVLALPNPAGVTRLGITVSSKVGNAVTRVRIRRHVREFYRAARAGFPQAMDVVVIARSSAKRIGHAETFAALEAMLPKLRKLFP